MKKISKIVIPPEIVDFYKELEQIKQRFVTDIPLLKLDESQKKCSLEQQVPLLNFINFKIEEKEAQEVFADLAGVVLKYQPTVTDEVAKIQNALKMSKPDLVYLVEKLVWQDAKCLDEFASAHSLDGELLSVLLTNTAKPFAVSVAASIHNQVAGEGWHQNFCPVCGWSPAISVTEASDERKRVMHCSLCDSRWHFKTLECPHCLNEDHETLKYFTVEDDEAYRLNVCEKCKGYIKSVDEGRLSVKESAALMDIRSIYLDLLASDNGYLKKTIGSMGTKFN